LELRQGHENPDEFTYPSFDVQLTKILLVAFYENGPLFGRYPMKW
jgi:hypothetical protein